MDTFDVTALLVCSIVISSCAGTFVGQRLDENYFRAEIIKHNAAHYDTVTGDWKWNTEVPTP